MKWHLTPKLLPYRFVFVAVLVRATCVLTLHCKLWLLGYEFPSTLMVFEKSPRKVTFVCGSSKGKIFFGELMEKLTDNPIR